LAPATTAADWVDNAVLQLQTRTKQAISDFQNDVLHSIERVEAPAGATDEMSHFVGQVKQDFCETHDELQSAMHDLVCAGKTLCGVPPTQGKCVFSSFCGGVAGAMVAGTLTPLRGARLAVAKYAACTPVPPTSDRAPHDGLDGAQREDASAAEVFFESEEGEADDAFWVSVEHHE